MSLDHWLPTLAIAFIPVFGVASLWLNRGNPVSSPLPPGPRPLPLVGNVFYINLHEPWVSYTNLGKIYGTCQVTFARLCKLISVPGELLYIRLLNQEVIVINSEEVAKDLLERRSRKYSDRPRMFRMLNDLWVVFFTPLSRKRVDRCYQHRVVI